MSNFPPERIEDALKFCCCSPYRNRQICIYAGGGSSNQHDMYWAYVIYDCNGDRIRRLSTPDDSQNWVIVRWRGEHFAKIHQALKRSVNLILYEVTQDGDLTTNHTTVTIRARIPTDAIRRGGSVEIGGMLLAISSNT